MGGCENVTKMNVSSDMIEKYPELKEKGFNEGDPIDIGIPYDGKVEGPTKKIGVCSGSCQMTTPTVDGKNGELWESSFVEEYFPNELSKLESLDSCYRDPVIKYSAGIMMQYSDDLSDPQDDALMRFTKGQASIQDMKILKPVLAATIQKAKKDGIEVKPLQILYKDISQKIQDNVISTK